MSRPANILILITLLFLTMEAMFLASPGAAEEFGAAQAKTYVEPPYSLGEPIGDEAWELINLDGRVAGYGFTSPPRAPLPGFSGAPINMFIQITTEGKFIDVDIVSHNEPIFVSGLGEAPFNAFVEQYKGHSIHDSLVVGVPYGDKDGASSLVYLKGVTKATASVRIAHETIIAAAFAIAREKLEGLSARAPSRPDPDYEENLTWQDLVDQGIATHRLVTNAEIDGIFKGTLFEDDDDIAKQEPDAPYLDLWVVDIGPPSVAKAALSPSTLKQLADFRAISPDDEPLLLIETGRHGLVSDEFVRNTSPDLLSASQDGLPIALRDADLIINLAEGVPDGVSMILRTDRRLGFDPASPWSLTVRAVREHGSFRPEIGSADLSVELTPDERFFITDKPPAPTPVWLQALQQRSTDMIILVAGLLALLAVLVFFMRRFASTRYFTPMRLAILAGVIGFVGWWGQGQLSIATPIGVIRSLYQQQSLAFLLYDPFSLAIWGVTIASFFLWGRGLFCGWLCPFGAMQEFTHHLGRLLKMPQLRVPLWLDQSLMKLKYGVLLAMIVAAFATPELNDTLIEVEPFKTAVTTYFDREWYFIAYAVGLLLLSAVLFKGFCRYLCPLGALMAIGGMLRIPNWVPRRVECGSPCQLCKVQCRYGAIPQSGKIDYSECFACLDCVTIHDDETRCVPLVLAARGRSL